VDELVTFREGILAQMESKNIEEKLKIAEIKLREEMGAKFQREFDS
jgi:hypothetical protein